MNRGINASRHRYNPLDDFLTVWEGTEINLPLSPAQSYDFRYSVDDSEFISSTENTLLSITGLSSGQHTLRIRSMNGVGFPSIRFNNGAYSNDIISILQWGKSLWGSLAFGFYGCSNLTINTLDYPILQNCFNTESFFRNCVLVNPDTAFWDVSNVTDMNNCFRGASIANPNVTDWNVSNVTNMSGMFRDCINANPNVTDWNTSSVLRISSTFYGASIANPNVTDWDVSSVFDMADCFRNCTMANPIVTGWDVSNVTNISGMFRDCINANINVTDWNTLSITDCRNAFRNCILSDLDLSQWDVSALLFASNILTDSGLTTSNLDSLYQSWSVQTLNSGVVFSASPTKYTSGGSAEASRLVLTSSFNNWVITDGGGT